MAIEKLSFDNLSAFTQLALELWPEGVWEEEREFYQSLISSENDACLMFYSKEAAVAFIHVSIRNDYVEGAEKSPTAYLEGIFVKPHVRKRGIGKRLIREAEIWAKSKGLSQLASDTPISNTGSVEFHTHAGFEEVERVVCFIKPI